MSLSKISFLLLVAIIAVSGCVSMKINKLSEQGQTAFQNNQYKEALSHYNEMISLAEGKDPKTEGKAHGEAGKAAYALNRFEDAISHFEKAAYLNYINEAMYVSFVQVTQKVDNLSKEITALEEYVQYFPDGEYIDAFKKRLYITYATSENWEKAQKLWDNLPDDAKKQEKYLEARLKQAIFHEQHPRADNIADQLLNKNPDHITALEWKAEKHFWRAEDSYQKEMKAYKNNRTTSQYKQLLKAFEQVNDDFKRSLKYFKRLYKLDPKKAYAEYLGNIYKRLDDEQTAKYYYDLAD
ncbi:MAG: hypothetical protein GVY19_01020 [Bacteroidetes bacterium]|jgi:tetratricopeptide (TPR) repeat protein|nr:hypothetical protein [Bacteroidota bacterium]